MSLKQITEISQLKVGMKFKLLCDYPSPFAAGRKGEIIEVVRLPSTFAILNYKQTCTIEQYVDDWWDSLQHKLKRVPSTTPTTAEKLLGKKS